MSQVSLKHGLAALIVGLALFGCSDPRSQVFNSDTGKHAPEWASPDVHGPSAKRADGFSLCADCHGADFSGGISSVDCSSCHGGSAPHPVSWTTGTRKHSGTDQSNAAVCAGCHANGANSPIAPPAPPAPAGTTPGCFNNTLCHGQAGHAAGWSNPANHGAAAKQAPGTSVMEGFSGCQSCHGTTFAGQGAARTCLQDSLCHGATVTSPHPQTPWRSSAGSVRTHTDTNTGNASVCASCHTLGALLTSIPVPTNLVGGTPGCFNNTLCHGQSGHAVGWAAPTQHGAAAKTAPSTTNMTGFSTCRTCHGSNFAGGTATTCLNTAGCHGAGVNSPHAQAPWVSSLTSTMTHTTTNAANADTCGLCHWNNVQPPTYVTPVPGTPNCFDNTLCHGPVPLTCVSCHNQVQTGTHGTPRDAVVGEFGLAWGHKKSGRGAVTDADCIVCHLEGQYSAGVGSAVVRTTYHKDGNIDLRDPDGAGETPITDMTGGTFTFTKFATSYAASARTSTGQLSNAVDNVLTQKFCLSCHDSDGATNTTARTAGGTQYMPWGGVNLGANYTVANGAAAAGGIVDAKTQFATTNSSVHPVLGPRSSDYPVDTRLAAPYNNIGTTRVAGAHNLANSVVLNCFDCHNTPTPLTNRTVAAHGNAVTLRGTIYVASPTLCSTCHITSGTGQYGGNTQNHGTGSAWAATGSNHGTTVMPNCHYCHGSNTSTTAPVRPMRAQDYHGNNALVGGGSWPTVNSRPYAFIRGWSGTAYHRPFRSTEFTTGSAQCGAGTCPGGGQVGDGSTRNYTPGGSY
jgi:hypothetical protein